MRLQKRMLILVLTLYMLCSVSASAAEYDISQINLNNIIAPKGFSVCTLDSCDSDFKSMLKSFNHTYEDWVEKVMIPGNIYFYASNNEDKNIYIKCEDISWEQKDHNSEKQDIYMYDYNLAVSNEEQRWIMDDYKRILTETGVNDRSIEMSYMSAGENLPTCYIVSTYISSGLWVCEFHTIYAGKDWTYLMSSPTELTGSDYNILYNLVSNVEYKYKVDYTHTKVVIRQNNQAVYANEQTMYIDSKDGRVVFLITTITIVFVIIYVITDKQRKKF